MPGDSFFLNLPKSLRSLEIELAMLAKQREDFHTDGHIKRYIERFPSHGISFNGMYPRYMVLILFVLVLTHFSVVTWDDENSNPI